MARLDRLATVREIAQMGATLGRGFSYEMLQAVSPVNEDRLQQGLRQLVEAEVVYQRGMPPQAQLPLQACSHSRCGLSVVAQEQPAAVSSADCTGVGRDDLQR